jgi:hypothetical protein
MDTAQAHTEADQPTITDRNRHFELPESETPRFNL